MAIAWEAVQRLMQYRVLRDAAAAQRMLTYVQAIDIPRSVRMSDSEMIKALQVVNMTRTGNALGMLPLYVGQRVRLTAKLSAKYGIVQDAVGVVQEVVFDEREFRDPLRNWHGDSLHPSRQAGFARLRYLPSAVLVRFDEFAHDFGLGEGVVVVQPRESRWMFNSHFLDDEGSRRLQEVSMKRIQFPLAPEAVRTAQTAQGMTFKRSVMFLERPSNMGMDDYWFHVYVMLSRVRCIKDLLIFSLPQKSLFKRGPPAFIRTATERLESMSLDSRARCASARNELG